MINLRPEPQRAPALDATLTHLYFRVKGGSSHLEPQKPLTKISNLLPGPVLRGFGIYIPVVANLGCQHDCIWNQLKPNHLRLPVEDFLD